MKKLVDGVEVDLTPEEVAARRAEEAAWAARKIPTEADVDQETLNRALAEPGSVVRALAELTFQEINRLRIKTGDAPYTMPLFIAALKARMR